MRADADERIGTGHLMRMLALGRAWKILGGSAEIIGKVDAQELRQRITEAGLIPHAMEATHPHSTDVENLREIARSGPDPDAIVLDGYEFDASYERVVGQIGSVVMTLDDRDRTTSGHDSTLLLNQNLHASVDLYSRSEARGFLLGPRYALLRKEFEPPYTERRIESVARRVLVMFGGGDPINGSSLTLRALAECRRLPKEVAVLVAATAPDRESIGTAADLLQELGVKVHIEIDSRSVREWMEWADLGVLAAGSTSWEAMATGLPALLIPVTDNQMPIAKALTEAGAAASHVWSAEPSLTGLTERLEDLMEATGTRAAYSEAARAIVDGSGARRVAATLNAWAARPPGTSLRRVHRGDEDPLLEMANDPTVRSRAFNPDPISTETHRNWFRKNLSSSTTRIWIVESKGQVAGQIRYDATDHGFAEIDVSVARPLRGRGIGTWLLRATPEVAQSELAVRRVEGYVLPDNEPSARAFINAGFTEGPRKKRKGRTTRCFFHE